MSILYENLVRPLTVFLMNKLFVKDIYGLENIPSDSLAIIAANHESYFDFLIIPSILKKRRTHIIAAKELASHPVLGIFAKNDKCVLVNREQPGITFFKESIKVLRRGNLLLVFPEGTRSTDGKVGPWKRAVVELAMLTGAPIIPASIKNSRKILPKGGKIIKLYKCSVKFSSPVTINIERDQKNAKSQIQKTCDSLRKIVIQNLKQMT